jgi:hypothetical protein
MKVKVIEWTGMPVGKELILPNELAELLIEQGKVYSIEKDVKISKRSGNKGGVNNLSTSESVVEGDTHE